MDCIVHGMAKSQTRLSDFHLLHFTQGHPQGILMLSKKITEALEGLSPIGSFLILS